VLGALAVAVPPRRLPAVMHPASSSSRCDPRRFFAALSRLHDHQPEGLRVDVATLIAKQLGLTPQWVFTPWTSLFARREEVRRVFQEATITRSGRKRRLHDLVLRREPGCAALDEGDGAQEPRRPEEAADVRPGRHDRPRLHQDEAASCEGALVYQATTPRSRRCRSAAATRSCSTRDRRLAEEGKPGAYGRWRPDHHHEQYGAVLQKGSKLTAQINTAIKSCGRRTISKLQKKWFNSTSRSCRI